MTIEACSFAALKLQKIKNTIVETHPLLMSLHSAVVRIAILLKKKHREHDMSIGFFLCSMTYVVTNLHVGGAGRRIGDFSI